MARKRMLDPTFWEDTRVKNLTPIERLFFIGCISIADDEGRLIGDPAFLRSRIFPYDELTIDQVKTMRDNVTEAMPGFVLYSDGEGEEYIAFRNWSTYQKPSYAKPSSLPRPPFVPHSSEKDEQRTRPTSDVRPQDSIGKDSIGNTPKGAKRDPRLDHPAIIGYRELARLHVPIALRDDWIACAEEVGTENLLAVVKEWVGKGHNPRNVQGMMNVAREGWNYEAHRTDIERDVISDKEWNEIYASGS